MNVVIRLEVPTEMLCIVIPIGTSNVNSFQDSSQIAIPHWPTREPICLPHGAHCRQPPVAHKRNAHPATEGPSVVAPLGPSVLAPLGPSYWAIVGCSQNANTFCSVNAVILLTKFFIDQKNTNANACTTQNQSYSPAGAKRHLNWFSHFCMVITETHNIKTCID